MGWCQGPGLNRRPKAYESSALPLSYPGVSNRYSPKGNRAKYYGREKFVGKQNGACQVATTVTGIGGIRYELLLNRKFVTS